jgi:hypothetical protein
MAMRDCTKNITSVIDLCTELLFCADKGDLQRQDESCGVLFGVVRDAAYRMADLAKKERERHIRNGTWDVEAEKKCDDAFQPTRKDSK